MQILSIIATEAPQMIATETDEYNLAIVEWAPYVLALLACILLTLRIGCDLSDKYTYSLIGALCIPLLLYGLYFENGKNSLQEATQNNISSTLNNKYGVKPLDNIILYKYNASSRLGLPLSLNDGRIPVVTKDGKDIEVVLELVNDGTDVKAYSLGAELPIL